MAAPSRATLNAVARWASYYRSNPHRFASDFLHIELRLFQKILLVEMNLCTSLVYIASRGQGKTFLSAIFCCIRCILYPGTKIVIASGTRGQALNVLEKIMMELRPKSPELAFEIDDKQTKINGTEAKIVFKNGSFIKVVTASDSARGNRANIILVDEFRLVPKVVIDTVLRRFLSNPRMPEYSELTKEEKKAEYAKERNKSLYLSSAYFTDHWSYAKCVDNFKFMLDEMRQDFVCALPYQLAIKEGLLRSDDVADEMAESDFSEVKWLMEMCAEFYGSTEGAFFDFETVAKNRKIKYPMLPDKIITLLGAKGGHNVRIPPKVGGEIRILSADIALMSSKKNNNDATAIFINQMMPTKAGRYTSNIVYAESCEGLHTFDQSLVIRKLFDEFACDYIVLDCSGLGLGIYDCLARDMTDSETGEIYPALSCCNNQEMADRCVVRGARKAIWAIKANASLNSECAYLLREGFRSGRIRLLVTEYDAEELLGAIQGYTALSPYEKALVQMPYIHTTLLINELIKLQHEEVGRNVRLYERSGMRKDRYSSLSYNYYVATLIEAKATKKVNDLSVSNGAFVFRAPKTKSVSRTTGRW